MASTYLPDIYDLTTPDQFQGDVDWYRRQAVGAGSPVLELGAGTGRIALPIAHAGIEIHALDQDTGMLEVLRKKASEAGADGLRIIEGNMRDFTLDTEYTFVLIPFRAFLHNLIYDDQLSCLRCVHRHLRTGGRLAFNVFFPSLEFIASNTGSLGGGWRWTEDVPFPDGGKLVRSEANRYDTVHQRVSSRHRFERFDTSGVLVSTHIQELELAYLFPGDIHRLLSDAGFEDIEILGGFDEREFSQDVEELVVRARRG